jgi:hypothetical protein
MHVLSKTMESSYIKMGFLLIDLAIRLDSYSRNVFIRKDIEVIKILYLLQESFTFQVA